MDMGIWLKDSWMYMSMSTEDGLSNVKTPVEDERVVMEEVGTVDVSAMNVSDMTITYVVDRNGVLKNMNMAFSAGMEMPMPMEGGTVMSMKLQYDYIVEMTIKATGSSVRIKYPDFSKFTEITYDEMDALA